MTKAPKTKTEAPEVDPKGGDAILKRMLQTTPKTHKEMVAKRDSGKSVSRKTKR